jgi:hypothetical protein
VYLAGAIRKQQAAAVSRELAWAGAVYDRAGLHVIDRGAMQMEVCMACQHGGHMGIRLALATCVMA